MTRYGLVRHSAVAVAAAVLLAAGCSNTNVLYETVALPHGPMELQTKVAAAARMTGDALLLVAEGETFYRTYYTLPPEPAYGTYIGFGYRRGPGFYHGDFGRYPPYYGYPPYPAYELYTVHRYEVFLKVSVENFPEPGAKVDLFPRQVAVTFGEFVAPNALARTDLVVESARAYWDDGKPVIEFQASSIPAPPAAAPPADSAEPAKGRTTVTVVQTPIYVRGKFKGDLSAKAWALVSDRFHQRGVAALMALPAE